MLVDVGGFKGIQNWNAWSSTNLVQNKNYKRWFTEGHGKSHYFNTLSTKPLWFPQLHFTIDFGTCKIDS